VKIIYDVNGIKTNLNSEFRGPFAELISLASGVPTAEKYSPHKGKIKFNAKNEE
jgi:hypothetical protein